NLLERLKDEDVDSFNNLVSELRCVNEGAPTLSRFVRAANIAWSSLCFVILFSASTVVLAIGARDVAVHPDAFRLYDCLKELDDNKSTQDKSALAQYIAGRFAGTFADRATWASTRMGRQLSFYPALAKKADELFMRTRPTLEETARAASILR